MPDGEPLICAGCGLVCDDASLECAGDGVRLAPPCRLGAEWLSTRLDRPTRPAATIDGQPADVEAALARAAELLRGARRPLLYGFEAATVEDARAAVALADRLGALIAATGVDQQWPGAPAVPLRGASTATLGEIRDRSRLVIIWREDPEASHPRLLERLALRDGTPADGASSKDGSGDGGPGEGGSGGGGAVSGRRERTLLVVDDRDTATAAAADVHLRWPRGRDLEALVSLRGMHRGLDLREADLDAPLGALLERIRGVSHVAILHGPGLTSGPGGQRRALALHELVRALSRERHVVTLALTPAAGTTGAQDALAWQSGYDGIVDFADGHPEPVTATRPVRAFEGVDVSMRVEAPAERPGVRVPEIVLGSLPAGPGVAVSMLTAAGGVEAAGTVHRLDGVPLALRAPRAGDAPTAAALLRRLLAEVQA